MGRKHFLIVQGKANGGSRRPYWVYTKKLLVHSEDIKHCHQHYEEIREASKWTRIFASYRTLWSATLYDALCLLESGNKAEKDLEAQWFLSNSTEAGSFKSICFFLQLDAEASLCKLILKGLLRTTTNSRPESVSTAG